MSRAPGVLVTDGHTNPALACVRSLGRAGFNIYVASHYRRRPLAAWSRHSRDWFWLGTFEDLGRDFRADTGFIPRVDTRRGDWITERTVWGTPDDWYTRLIFGAWGTRVENHDGMMTDSDIGLHGLLFGPRQSFLFARLAGQTEFFDGVTYDRTIGEFFFNIRPSGDLTFSLGGKLGGAVDYDNDRPGRLVRLVPGVTLNLGRHFRARLDHTFERLNVAGGRLYRANLSQLRLVYQFNPQTLVYVGYSDDHTTEDFIDLTRKDRTLFVKLGCAWVM